jgi:PAB-dependent poly(A)-specific ribonuclease subunit 3
VYDYHPLAVTLFDAFVKPRSASSGARSRKSESSESLEEDLLWSFIIQISNAMKAVHDRGMAFRTIDSSKILLTEKTRYIDAILRMVVPD